MARQRFESWVTSVSWIQVDGEPVVEIGPGSVVGERAGLTDGRRTATLVARSAARVASVPADALDPQALDALSASRDE